MTITLFTLIAWFAISAFFLIPKGLTLEENIIIFFIIAITIISIYTILALNVNLIHLSDKPTDFIATCIHRNIIIPVIMLTLLNTLFFYTNKYKRLVAIIVSLITLIFTDMLTIWAGTRFFTGWNHFFTLASLIALILIFYLITKLLRKLT